MVQELLCCQINRPTDRQTDDRQSHRQTQSKHQNIGDIKSPCVHCAPLYSSWWRTPSRALPYWRLVAKYPYLLPSSMLYGPQSSRAGHPHLLFSARWLVGDQRASSSLLVVLEQRWWHGGGLPQGPSEPGVQRTSGGRTSSCQKLASTRWCSYIAIFELAFVWNFGSKQFAIIYVHVILMGCYDKLFWLFDTSLLQFESSIFIRKHL